MSDARRKRQQEREGIAQPNPQSRKRVIWGSIVVLCVAAYSAIWYRDTHHYDAFAKCLASKQVKMYGLYWCPHCIEQKQKFGKSIQYVPYFECAIKGSREMATECKAVGAKNFPSWQFEAGGPLREGELSLEDLSGRTGCSLP
jgi:hypothetical protein